MTGFFLDTKMGPTFIYYRVNGPLI